MARSRPSNRSSKLAFHSERHWHTQFIESQGQGGILVRPRVPVDFTNRTLTIEFEVDLPPVQSDIHDKWFEVQVSNQLPASAGTGNAATLSTCPAASVGKAWSSS